jgi:FtsZ-binding cell division protein ZapB
MNMFQHLQTYYVQPLEEENKKLRQELSDITRSLTGLKEENRKLTDTSSTLHARDTNFLDQLKFYQFEIDCNPSFLSYDDDEDMLPEGKYLRKASYSYFDR